MIPKQHRQESLQRAYITAVAAQAGIKASFGAGTEYGVDGEFRLVSERVTVTGVSLLSEVGYSLDFQLKSTTNCRGLVTPKGSLSYDCAATAYNKLILQNQTGMVPILLLVLCLPANDSDWLNVTEDALILRNACYWHYVYGTQSKKGRSQVIRIPRSQLFTPGALKDIMERVQAQDGRL